MSGGGEPFGHRLRPWTVGELRKALEGMPDDLPVRVMITEMPDGDLIGEHAVISAGPWHGEGEEAAPGCFEIGCDFPASQYRRQH